MRHHGHVRPNESNTANVADHVQRDALADFSGWQIDHVEVARRVVCVARDQQRFLIGRKRQVPRILIDRDRLLDGACAAVD